MTTLKAGTRGSQLAWTQAGQALERIGERVHGGASFERVRIDTRGDRDRSTSLKVMPGSGLFTKEIEAALLAGEVDLAIHSLKDVPYEVQPGTELHMLPREDPRDALISPHGGLDALPEGALVGTGSPRRIAQLRNRRPDLRFSDIRGNLDTRLRRLDDGEFHAIVLASAGLSRLGWTDRITERLDPGICLPAFGQGVLAVQCLAGSDVSLLLERASDPDTTLCAGLERDLMRALGGGCKRALAALAETVPEGVRVRGAVGDPRTGDVVRLSWIGARDAARAGVERLALDLLDAAREAGLDADA